MTPELITLDCDNEYFQVPGDTLWAGKNFYELEVETHLPREWHRPIIDCAKAHGLDWFSSPFDHSAIEFLEQLECPVYKIASGEMRDLELVEQAASIKPVNMSTGIADYENIKLAKKEYVLWVMSKSFF